MGLFSYSISFDFESLKTGFPGPRGSKDHQQMGYRWEHMMIKNTAISAFTTVHFRCLMSVQYRACNFIFFHFESCHILENERFLRYLWTGLGMINGKCHILVFAPKMENERFLPYLWTSPGMKYGKYHFLTHGGYRRRNRNRRRRIDF